MLKNDKISEKDFEEGGNPTSETWTDIMRYIFRREGEIATSAPVESEFSSLKNTAFPQIIRVDKFIHSRIEYLYKKVRLVAADAQKLEEKPIKIE